MSPSTEFSLEKLRAVVAKKPRYKAILEAHLGRKRGRQDSTPSRLRRVLREGSDLDYPLNELVEFFRDMEAVGAGRWVSARDGKEGRFVWAFHLVSVAEAVLKKHAKNLTAEQVRSAPEPKIRLPKVVISEPDTRPEISNKKPNLKTASFRTPPVETRKLQPVPPAPVSNANQPVVRIDVGGGQFVEAPIGMTKEQMKEFALFLKTIRDVHGNK